MPRKRTASQKGKSLAAKLSETKNADDKVEETVSPWLASLMKRKDTVPLPSDETEESEPVTKKPRRKSSSKGSKKSVQSETVNTDDNAEEEETADLGDSQTDGDTSSAPLSGFLSQYLTEDSWVKLLADEFNADYFKDIDQLLQKDYNDKEKEIFPPKEKIFHAFNSCPFDKTKVVILGQDPYHDDGQACGMAFGVSKDVPAPQSLKNIFKELTTDIEGFEAPEHGRLDKWAEEGILLMNATLTVEAHQPNSHKKYGWQTFTNNVIKKMSSAGKGIVFILWGAFAHKKEALIDKTKHGVVKAAHPSGCSFYKFRDCKCFSKTNTELKRLNSEPVDWSLE